MITLLTFAPAFGQPAASPFCVKAMMLLNMAGVEWTPEYLSDPRKMPYSKLPAIRVNGEIIADSDNIRLWLEARGAEFNQGLTRAEMAYSRALIRMAEEHLYFHVGYDRWGMMPFGRLCAIPILRTFRAHFSNSLPAKFASLL